MLAAFVEAALRSLILAIVVWTALRLFRIRNVNSQRSAWTAVLVGALLMPLVLPLMAHWPRFSFATIAAPASLNHFRSALAPAPTELLSSAKQSTFRAAASAADRVRDQVRAAAIIDSISTPEITTVKTDHTAALSASPSAGRATAMSAAPQKPNEAAKMSPLSVAVLAYFLVTAGLLIRLLFGLASAMHLWLTSTPIPPVSDVPFGADLNLRWSTKVSAPVTIGSGIVLPAGYKNWTREKTRIALAHERSHVIQHDFLLQILASLYSALVWFSPLGWWLKSKLSDLGEAISDRSGLNEAPNRSAYAEVLLEFAAAPRPTLIGVAMARPSSISRRIERLLNDSYLRHAFTGGRARIVLLVAPAVLFAGAALVRVQAATEPVNAVHAQASAATPHATPAVTISPSALAIVAPLQPREMALATPPAPPPPPPAPASSAAAVENAAGQSEATFDRDLTFSGKLDLSVGTGAGNIRLTRGAANRLRVHGVVKSNQPGNEAEVQQIAANPPIEQNGNVVRIGGKQEGQHNISISYEIEAPADTELSAASGSGNITDEGVGQGAKLMTGSGNITATGIEGGFKIQTGSGNIAIDGTGQGDAKAQTGSGNIELKGVNGALIAQTGSGAIKAAGTPSSPWKLQTGSGPIELTTGNAPMNLDASVGSGNISTDRAMALQTSEDRHHVTGQLNGGGPEVRVETGSGDVRIH